jgi:hypothetical protein
MVNQALSKAEASAQIQKIFDSVGCTVKVSSDDLRITRNCVIVALREQQLAKVLFDEFFPRASSGAYYHFTSYEAFKKIVSSGRLRLYNLHKRFGSGEFRTFCRDHGLSGYVSDGDHGEETGEYKTLMDDLFYASFVAADCANSGRLWERFGNKHKGVRLTFQIEASKYEDFRSITYQGSARIAALRQLQQAFWKYDRHFVTAGLSRMGGYYQRLDFRYQAEHRLLVKRFPQDESFPFVLKSERGQKYQYIECDISGSTALPFTIELTEVVAGCECPLQKIAKYVEEKSAISNIVVRSVSGA